MAHHKLSAVVLTAVLAIGGAASADPSRAVISAFHGQIVVTKDELTAALTPAKVKDLRLKEVVGEAHDAVSVWNFHYTAFLTKTGATDLKLEFYTDDKDKRFVADKRLDGVDPKTGVLSGDITIDEDEGLAKGKSYIVKLQTGKDETIAQTPLTMK
jgi:hypothetical protein